MTELKKMDYDRTADTAVASGDGAAESRHDLHLPLRAKGKTCSTCLGMAMTRSLPACWSVSKKQSHNS